MEEGMERLPFGEVEQRLLHKQAWEQRSGCLRLLFQFQRQIQGMKFSDLVHPSLSISICQILLLTDRTFSHSQYSQTYFPLCTLTTQEGDADFIINECRILSNSFSVSVDDEAMRSIFFSLLICNIIILIDSYIAQIDSSYLVIVYIFYMHFYWACQHSVENFCL